MVLVIFSIIFSTTLYSAEKTELDKMIYQKRLDAAIKLDGKSPDYHSAIKVYKEILTYIKDDYEALGFIGFAYSNLAYDILDKGPRDKCREYRKKSLHYYDKAISCLDKDHPLHEALIEKRKNVAEILQCDMVPEKRQKE